MNNTQLLEALMDRSRAAYTQDAVPEDGRKEFIEADEFVTQKFISSMPSDAAKELVNECGNIIRLAIRRCISKIIVEGADGQTD